MRFYKNRKKLFLKVLRPELNKQNAAKLQNDN